MVTVWRAATLSPRIRYNVHDAGGTLSFARMTRDLPRLRPRSAGRQPHRSAAPVLRMPLLYVHGRSDSTVSVHGANIYPEDVGQGLAESPDAAAVAGFVLDLAEDEAGVIRPLVHVETWRGPAAPTGELTGRLAAAVRARLMANSADFRTAVTEDPAATANQVWAARPGAGRSRSGRPDQAEVRTMSSTVPAGEPCRRLTARC